MLCLVLLLISVPVLQQLLVLETSLFLNGLDFYDQHRDMRLDIDNMSYEVCFCFAMSVLSIYVLFSGLHAC